MSIDTVNDLSPRVQYVASASQTVFDYPFPIFADADLVVDVDGTTQTLNTQYTVAGEGDDLGGTITRTTPSTAGQVVTIYRDIAIARDTDVSQNGPWSSVAYNDEQDKAFLIMQQLKAQLMRSLRLPIIAEVDDAELEINVANFANKYLTFDADGVPTPAVLVSGSLTRPVIGGLLHPQTALELAAAVVPLDFAYPPGDVRRYGAVGDGATNDGVALDAAFSTGHAVEMESGKTYVTDRTLTVDVNGTSIFGNGATVLALGTANFENVVYATARAGVKIFDLTVNVNKASRESILTTRSCGIYLDGCTEPMVRNCTVANAIGTAVLPGIGIAFAGATLRGQIANCVVRDCGVTGKAADGIYTSGTQNLIVDCIALNCNDTGAVIENSNHCGLVGFTARGCSAVFAITNAQNTAVDGNFAEGVTGYDWNSSVTGGIQIGNPSAATTGDLRNTRLSGITMERVAGAGPAINVRKTGTARTIGLTISATRIKGSGAQSILAVADDLLITGCDIQGGSNNAAIQIGDDSDRVQIVGNTVRGQFTFGIFTDGNSDVNCSNNLIDGDAANSTHGIYFAGTGSRCRALFNLISDMTVARIGSDAGTTPTVFSVDQTSTAHALVHTKAETQLIGARILGYTNPMTGTANRATSYATGTITLVQLAERVKALQDDLTTHGLIGA